MSTNYYLYNYDEDVDLHIGKLSVGWCFALRLYPEKGIKLLSDWNDRFLRSSYIIGDEYGNPIRPSKMIEIIIGKNRKDTNLGPDSNSILGPNNLLRCKIGYGLCVGHGQDAYDYMIGDFS